jgi:hypothetical protein
VICVNPINRNNLTGNFEEQYLVEGAAALDVANLDGNSWSIPTEFLFTSISIEDTYALELGNEHAMLPTTTYSKRIDPNFEPETPNIVQLHALDYHETYGDQGNESFVLSDTVVVNEVRAPRDCAQHCL